MKRRIALVLLVALLVLSLAPVTHAAAATVTCYYQYSYQVTGCDCNACGDLGSPDRWWRETWDAYFCDDGSWALVRTNYWSTCQMCDGCLHNAPPK